MTIVSCSNSGDGDLAYCDIIFDLQLGSAQTVLEVEKLGPIPQYGGAGTFTIVSEKIDGIAEITESKFYACKKFDDCIRLELLINVSFGRTTSKIACVIYDRLRDNCSYRISIEAESLNPMTLIVAEVEEIDV